MRALRTLGPALAIAALLGLAGIVAVKSGVKLAGVASLRTIGQQMRAWISGRLNSFDVPQERFFLFGMGNRRKLLYRDGKLLDAFTGEVVAQWEVQRDFIHPSEYTVMVETVNGTTITINEDDQGVWIISGSRRTLITAGQLSLPKFEGHPHAALLRQLLHEVLINVVDGRPLPNLFVYAKPWYRDAAVMAMVLQKTDNLHLIAGWIRGLSDPFDYNNGRAEPDNLGQALYLISLIGDKAHPLVDRILDTLPEYVKDDYIVGLTDGAEHPVYQTAWLKFGLRSLGLPDPYQVPDIPDSYATLLWMMPDIVGPRRDAVLAAPSPYYPYLAWARDHFFRRPPSLPVRRAAYPISYEAQASQADYSKMGIVSEKYVMRKICLPHAWHAAEMFLYYLDADQEGVSRV